MNGGASSIRAAASPHPVIPGRTEGTASVSPSGEATYEIPLWTPPGVRNLAPRLSLVYSSGSPDSILGPGWSLGGLSVISRCPATWAQDQAPANITLTMSDKFCLDGQRLRITSGTYGQANSTYQTELADFSRVTASAALVGNGPASFTVRGKDGLIYEYGATTDSRIFSEVAPGTSATTPYLWALDKVSDRLGNNMVINYATGNGSYAPTYIAYTQTATGTDYNHYIYFRYVTRETGQSVSTNMGGTHIQQTSLLTSIYITTNSRFNGDDAYRGFILSYENGTATGRNRLNSLQDCTTSHCLAPTTITYQNGVAGIATPQTSVGITPDASPRAVDVNGDGRMDLVYPVASGTNDHWYVKFANGSGFGSPVDTQIITPAGTPVLLDDFLGSGRTDLLSVSGGNWYLLHWTGTGSISGFTSTPTGAPSSGALATSADVNGDGLPDLLWVDTTTNKIFGRLNAMNNGALAFDSTPFVMYTAASAISGIYGDNSFPASTVHKIDFNGDGIGDIAMTLTADTSIGFVYSMITVVSSRTATPVFSAGRVAGPLLHHTASPNIGAPINWNDDRCTDWAKWDDVAIAPCDGSPAGEATLPASGPAKLVAVLDWDGDGREDALYVGSNGHWIVGRATGTSDSPVGGDDTGLAAATYPNLIPFDTDGDGLDDLIAASTNYSTELYGVHNAPGTRPDLATTFTDGYGMATTFSYAPLPTYTQYTAYGDGAYPDADWTGPRYVTSSLAVANGFGGQYTKQYAYYGARRNLQGRGFDGFDQQRILDSRNSQYDYLTYSRTFPTTGQLLRDRLLQPNNATPIHDVINTPATLAQMTLDATANNQRYFPYISQSAETDYEIQAPYSGASISSVTSTFGYDGYGNTTSISKTSKDIDANNSPWYGATWSSTETSTYVNDNSANWCIGLISGTVSTNTANSASVTRTTSYIQDTNTSLCRNSMKIDEPTIPLQKLTTTFGFDGCGNVNAITLKGTNPDGTAMTPRITEFDFKSRCVAPESVTRVLSDHDEQITYSYDYNYGELRTQTDANNLTTTWDYDDFGRVRQKTEPSGQYSTYTLFSCSTPPCWGVNDLRAAINEKIFWAGDPDHPNGDQLTSILYYWDGFNRLRYKQSQHAMGDVVYDAIYGYDDLGNQVWQYAPVVSGSNGYTTWNFDGLNRVTAEILSQGSGALDRFTQYDYAGRKVTFTDAKGIGHTRYVNVIGQLGRVVDPSPGGTTDYTYDPFGNLTQVTDASNNVSSWTYNSRGYKIGSSDPDRGAWTYTPDSLGELRSQQDAKSQVTTFNYDLLGRLTTRTEAEGTSTWTWGKSAADQNVSQLVSISSPGYSETYTYGNSGRPATTTFSADSTYTITWNYWLGENALRDVTFPALPGASALHLYVFYGGAEQAITGICDYDDLSKCYYLLAAEDAWGHPSQEKLFNGVQINSAYDPLTGHLVSRTSGTASPFSNQQNLEYVYDKNENLTDRIDHNQSGLDEHFQYDALNRLSYSTLTGVSGHTLDVALDPSGNINSKSDVGTYTYNATHKHAVASTSNGWSFSYDNNGNMIAGRGNTIGWTSFNMPSSIANGSVSSSFSYTPDRRYWKQVAQYANGSATTVSLGNMFQKVVGATTEYRHQINAGSAVIDLIRSSGSNNNIYYITRDHLGSASVVTNSAGAVVLNESFGAYGSRRGSNWQGVPGSTDYSNIASITREGYTGHAMLDNLNMIHMNGRVFDNTIGRFLSPDPVVDEPTQSQAFDPYSYVFNSPLNFWDPSGFDCSPGVEYDDSGVGEVGICSPLEPLLLPPPDLVPIEFNVGQADTLWRNSLRKLSLMLVQAVPCPAGGPVSNPGGSRGYSVLLPNGQTVADRFSPTGNLMSPTPDLSPVNNDAKAVRLTFELMMRDAESSRFADTFRQSSLIGLVGQGGKFDYQRQGNFITGFTQRPQYRDVSNFNVGLVAQRVGATEDDVLSTAGLFAFFFSSNYRPDEPYGLDPRTLEFTHVGYSCAATGAFGKP